MRHQKGLRKREFQQELERLINGFDATALRKILRGQGDALDPDGRRDFLDRLKEFTETSDLHQDKSPTAGLLEDIDALAADVQATLDDWEPDYGDYRYDFDDEDGTGPIENFVEPVKLVLDRVDALFDDGDFATARQCYERLFQLFELENDYGHGLNAADLAGADMVGVRARYLRTVYETEPIPTRPAVVLEKLRLTAGWWLGQPPMVDALFQASAVRPLDQDEFLDGWIELLNQTEHRDADAWLREATRLRHGRAGLEALARAQGKQRPRVFVDLLAALTAEANWVAVMKTARDALKIVPRGLPIRAAIADHFAAAAIAVYDSKALHDARWEAFIARPELPRLLDLWDAEDSAAARRKRMHAAAAHIKARVETPDADDIEFTDEPGLNDRGDWPVHPTAALLAHARLLSGDWDAALALATAEKSLGWSNPVCSQPRVLAISLARLCKKPISALPRRVKEFADRYLFPSVQWLDWTNSALDDADEEMPNGEDTAMSVKNPTEDRLRKVYDELLASPAPTPSEKKLLDWSVDVTRNRIDAIVKNQRRRSYGGAASLLGAYVEVLSKCDRGRDAAQLVAEIRSKYPRHRAFQTELDAVEKKTERAVTKKTGKPVVAIRVTRK